MSKNKRKAIVFDLDGPKNTKFQRPSPVARSANVRFTSEEEGEKPESTWVPYMQPETLTLPFMLEVLDEGKIKLSNEARTTKKEVEKHFLMHITSKPQRSHRSTRLGQALSRLQRLCSTYHTPEWHKLVQDSKTVESSPSTSQLLPATAAAATDRLKPPVQSCINKARKTIKLGGAKKDAASLPASSTASPSKPLDKTDALLKSTPKSSPKSSSEDIKPSTKRVLSIDKSSSNIKKLKTVETVSAASSSVEKSPSTPKKKHASVSWP